MVFDKVFDVPVRDSDRIARLRDNAFDTPIGYRSIGLIGQEGAESAFGEIDIEKRKSVVAVH